jgi:hypothetical protein|tara:strand:+ start:304 stop:834 length:531 start_codon:yes stop_codon:yes gene_type:complete
MSARLIAAFILVTVFMSFMFIAPAYAVDTVTSATVSSSTVIDKAPPTASSPSIVVNNSDICQVGSSAALQTGLFGVSGGTTTRDFVCERVLLARSVFGMGLKVAGISLLCQDKRVWDALWMAGTPCPFQGAIGEAAKAQWLADPERAPKGSMIRVDEAAAAEVAATEYPEDEEMYE